MRCTIKSSICILYDALYQNSVNIYFLFMMSEICSMHPACFNVNIATEVYTYMADFKEKHRGM